MNLERVVIWRASGSKWLCVERQVVGCKELVAIGVDVIPEKGIGWLSEYPRCGYSVGYDSPRSCWGFLSIRRGPGVGLWLLRDKELSVTPKATGIWLN